MIVSSIFGERPLPIAGRPRQHQPTNHDPLQQMQLQRWEGQDYGIGMIVLRGTKLRSRRYLPSYGILGSLVAADLNGRAVCPPMAA
jgi:hypothetical protein